MKIRYHILAFVLISILTQPIRAQENIKAIPLPTGSGARALGQGGAFIAVADDATAASWNPAGLINLERPEFSVVGAYLSTDQDYSVDPVALPGVTMGDEDVSRWDVNFMSMAYPFIFLNKNVVASINYHQIYDFHLDLSIGQTVSGSTFDLDQQINFKSSGGVGALSPAFSILLLPKLSIGFAVNIYDDEFFGSYAWKESNTIKGRGDVSGDPFSTFLRSKSSSKDYHGVNASIGVLWNIWKKEYKRLTFGAVFDSPYTARFDRESTSINIDTLDFDVLKPRLRDVFISKTNEDARIRMDWPMSFGIGWGFRYSNALSFAFDVTWTHWSEWVQKTKISGAEPPGNSWQNSRPIGGGSEHDEIDDTIDVRFGTQYLIIRKKDIMALRGGLFYEQRASLGTPNGLDEEGNAVDFDGDPTDVWGFSMGVGYSTDRFSLDAAYQFRYVRDMEGNDIGLNGTSFDATENMILTSLIVYF